MGNSLISARDRFLNAVQSRYGREVYDYCKEKCADITHIEDEDSLVVILSDAFTHLDREYILAGAIAGSTPYTD